MGSIGQSFSAAAIEQPVEQVGKSRALTPEQMQRMSDKMERGMHEEMLRACYSAHMAEQAIHADHSVRYFMTSEAKPALGEGDQCTSAP